MFLWTVHQYLICHMFPGIFLCFSELSTSIWAGTCFLVSCYVSLNCPPVSNLSQVFWFPVMFLWNIHQYLNCHMFPGFLLCFSEISTSIWTVTCILVSCFSELSISTLCIYNMFPGFLLCFSELSTSILPVLFPCYLLISLPLSSRFLPCTVHLSLY
jgi:hypothetical protein